MVVPLLKMEVIFLQGNNDSFGLVERRYSKVVVGGAVATHSQSAKSVMCVCVGTSLSPVVGRITGLDYCALFF